MLYRFTVKFYYYCCSYLATCGKHLIRSNCYGAKYSVYIRHIRERTVKGVIIFFMVYAAIKKGYFLIIRSFITVYSKNLYM